MRDALAEHDDVLRASPADIGGIVFKTFGDAFCCAFARAARRGRGRRCRAASAVGT